MPVDEAMGFVDPVERRFSRLLEAVTTGVVVHDIQGRITYANQAACEMLSLTKDQLLGRTSLDPGWEAIREDGSPFPGEEHPAMVALRTGQPVHDVVMGVYSQKAERFRWILIDAEAVLEPATGAPAEVLVTFRDITVRIRSQQELRQSEQRFRNLIETTNDWVWEVDENLVYTYASPRVRDILGYEPEEVLGRTPWGSMTPEEARRVSEIAADIVRSRLPFSSLENTNLHKAGRSVVLETSGLPFFDAGGEFRGYRGIDRDITNRKRAEEALRKSEAFIRSITDLVPSRISYLDTKQCYRFVNRKYEELFATPSDEIIGKHARQVLGEALYERVRPYIEEVLSGKELTYELLVDASGGGQRHLRIAYVPHCEENQEVLGFFASIEDITEQKRLEEQLRQSQKMEAVGVLAGGIAHDFNNLLTVIAGYSVMIVEALGPNHPLSKQAEEIVRAGERAASLTRQLLAFSRKQMLQPRVVDLNDVVAGLETMLQRLLDADIVLSTQTDPTLGRVKADPGQIEQVIMNLVVNARDAMPQGGSLKIETKNVELDEAYAKGHIGLRPGRYAMLGVSDTGQGMDEETRTHIFEPFFTTKEMGRGTGLGLSTIYGIVQQSGGHIAVQSEPGAGTTF